MNFEQLTEMKSKQEREAKKWIAYLESLPTKEGREKELTRKLMETFLEGSRATREEIELEALQRLASK
jgi:hypothetical protein